MAQSKANDNIYAIVAQLLIQCAKIGLAIRFVEASACMERNGMEKWRHNHNVNGYQSTKRTPPTVTVIKILYGLAFYFRCFRFDYDTFNG